MKYSGNIQNINRFLFLFCSINLVGGFQVKIARTVWPKNVENASFSLEWHVSTSDKWRHMRAFSVLKPKKITAIALRWCNSNFSFHLLRLRHMNCFLSQHLIADLQYKRYQKEYKFYFRIAFEPNGRLLGGCLEYVSRYELPSFSNWKWFHAYCQNVACFALMLKFKKKILTY